MAAVVAEYGTAAEGARVIANDTYAAWNAELLYATSEDCEVPATSAEVPLVAVVDPIPVTNPDISICPAVESFNGVTGIVDGQLRWSMDWSSSFDLEDANAQMPEDPYVLDPTATVTRTWNAIVAVTLADGRVYDVFVPIDGGETSYASAVRPDPAGVADQYLFDLQAAPTPDVSGEAATYEARAVALAVAEFGDDAANATARLDRAATVWSVELVYANSEGCEVPGVTTPAPAIRESGSDPGNGGN